jgi:hypothetical protein
MPPASRVPKPRLGLADWPQADAGQRSAGAPGASPADRAAVVAASRWRRRAPTTSSGVRLPPSRGQATKTLSCRRVDCGLEALAGTERHTWTTGAARRLRKLGDGEQDGRVLDCMQRVPRLGNDQEVAVASFPLGGVSNEPHPSAQHLEGRLAGILVF